MVIDASADLSHPRGWLLLWWKNIFRKIKIILDNTNITRIFGSYLKHQLSIMKNVTSFYANIFTITKDGNLKFAKMNWSRPYTTKASAKRGLERKTKRMAPQDIRKFVSAKLLAREMSMETLQRVMGVGSYL
jgi:hypothetical protein